MVGLGLPGAEHVVHHEQLVVIGVIAGDAQAPDVDVYLGRVLVGHLVVELVADG